LTLEESLVAASNLNEKRNAYRTECKSKISGICIVAVAALVVTNFCEKFLEPALSIRKPLAVKERPQLRRKILNTAWSLLICMAALVIVKYCAGSSRQNIIRQLLTALRGVRPVMDFDGG
jgi:hypothetical protein